MALVRCSLHDAGWTSNRYFRTIDKTHAILQRLTLIRDCYRVRGSSLLKKCSWIGVYLHSYVYGE
jgi:hypothetical protein